MRTDIRSRRRRELAVVIFLSLVIGCGLLLFLLLIGGETVLAMMVAAGFMLLYGCLHYLLWGKMLGHGANASHSSGRPKSRAVYYWDDATPRT